MTKEERIEVYRKLAVEDAVAAARKGVLHNHAIRNRMIVLQLEDELITGPHVTLETFGGDVKAALRCLFEWETSVNKYFENQGKDEPNNA